MGVESLGVQNINDYRSGIDSLKKITTYKGKGTNGGVPFSAVLAKKKDIPKNDKLYEQCVELETFFLKNLISSMRKTIDKSSFLDSGFAGEMYEDMLYDEYTKEFAKNAGFGFAEMAYRELTRKQG